jgi:hypothetical protein
MRTGGGVSGFRFPGMRAQKKSQARAAPKSNPSLGGRERAFGRHDPDRCGPAVCPSPGEGCSREQPKPGRERESSLATRPGSCRAGVLSVARRGLLQRATQAWEGEREFRSRPGVPFRLALFPPCCPGSSSSVPHARSGVFLLQSVRPLRRVLSLLFLSLLRPHVRPSGCPCPHWASGAVPRARSTGSARRPHPRSQSGFSSGRSR